MMRALELDEANYNPILEKIGAVAIFNYLQDYGSGMSSLCKYADKRGNFVSETKYKTDLIAQAIFKQLDAVEQLQIYQYFEWLNNNPEG